MIRLKQIIPKHYCLKCSGCCRFSDKETMWSAHLLKEEIAEGRKNIKLIPCKEYYICNFFGFDDNKCRVYKNRPFECRIYPFLLKKDNKKVYLSLDLKCPFVDNHLNTAEFKKYSRYLARLLSNPRYKKLLRNNPQIFQPYPDVLDVAEIKD